jgi:hypothetical protein
MLHNDYIYSNEFKKKYKVDFQLLYERFIPLLDDYENQSVGFKKVLESEKFKNEFKNNLSVHDDFENLEDISYEGFMPLFLKYLALKKIENRLNENSELYKLMYMSNDFSEFTLEKFEGHVVNSEVFQKFYKKINPLKEYPKAEIVRSEFGAHFEIALKEKEEDPKNSKLTKDIYTAFDFDSNEQALVLNLCLSDKNNIPLTEKVKLLIMIGKIKDESIFNESAANNNFYNKVAQGTSRKGSTETMLELIARIKIKIDENTLKLTTQRLNILENTIKAEQNKAKNR